MSASEVSALSSLPLTVTITGRDIPTGSVNLPAVFKVGSEWQINVFPHQWMARIKIHQVEGGWVLCSVADKPTENMWVNLASFVNVSFEEVPAGTP